MSSEEFQKRMVSAKYEVKQCTKLCDHVIDADQDPQDVLVLLYSYLGRKAK